MPLLWFCDFEMLIDFAKEQEKENELVDFLKKTTGNLDIPIGAKTETVEVDVNGDSNSGDPMDPLKKYDLDVFYKIQELLQN